MSYKAEILADSISPDGVRMITILCVYPRWLHPEVLRHRTISHSVASSRAIPTEKNIEQVRTNPYIPATFNKRVKGMGVGDELDPEMAEEARQLWCVAADNAALSAEALNDLGLDKSRANRILEPFMWVSDIMSATDWNNFFALRLDVAAQIEFQLLARMMRDAMDVSQPQQLDYGMWHLPLVDWDAEKFPVADVYGGGYGQIQGVLKKVSASRCARASFDRHLEPEPIEKSLERAERLLASGHLSPFEHVARPMTQEDVTAYPHSPVMVPAHTMGMGTGYGPHSLGEFSSGNFTGWVQMRSEIPNEDDFGKLKKEVVT